MKILFLTRSNWYEPHRLRHQTALLLLSRQHEVYFVQKPRSIFVFLLKLFAPKSDISHINRLTICESYELIHHQLRVIPFLHYINSIVYNWSLKSTIALDSFDCVINFNYDAYRISKLLPSDTKLITIINDDFEAHCKLPFNHHITWSLSRSCRSSDVVLAPSSLLCKRLSAFNQSHLFLPWSDKSYAHPVSSSSRLTLLYWGYIDDRLDFSLLYNSLSLLKQLGLNLHFVGPIKASVRSKVKLLNQDACFRYSPPCGLDELDASNYIAAWLSYDINSKGLQATYLPNKALQMLSIGLPIISPHWTELLDHPAIIRYDQRNPDSLLSALRTVLSDFNSLQPSISSLVSSNSSSSRYTQLINLISQ